jgi:putative MFS transporter
MNIAQRIDSLPMTPFMRKIIFLVGIGWLFDAMDQGMVSGVIASIGDWELGSAQLGLLSSSGQLGMILGAALSGIAADRWGRRTVIVFTLLVFSVGSALCGLAVSYQMLLVCRFLTGFGLGGELPAASTLVSEFSPVASRGRNVVILESFWAWGWIAAALVAYLVIPVFGWRAAFLVGAVPALFAAVLRFMIPESPRYLAARGRLDEAEHLVRKMEDQAGRAADTVVATPARPVDAMAASPVAPEIASSAAPTVDPGVTSAKTDPVPAADPGLTSPFAAFKQLWSKEHLRSTAVLWVLWLGINLGYYGFVLWTPSLLMAQGFDMVKSFGFTLLMCVAQLPGYLAAAISIEKLGRKPTLTVFFAGTAAAAWLFGHATSESQILAFGCLLYFFALGAWGCVYSYTPELYPTDIRGSGTGWAAAFGRLGALVAPMILPVLYGAFGAENGYAGVFVLLTGVFLAVAIIVGIFGRETKGKAL